MGAVYTEDQLDDMLDQVEQMGNNPRERIDVGELLTSRERSELPTKRKDKSLSSYLRTIDLTKEDDDSDDERYEQWDQKRNFVWKNSIKKTQEKTKKIASTEDVSISARKHPTKLWIPLEFISPTPDQFLDRAKIHKPDILKDLIQSATDNPLAFIDLMQPCKFIIIYCGENDPMVGVLDPKLVDIKMFRKHEVLIFPACGNHRVECFRHMRKTTRNEKFDDVPGECWLMRFEDQMDYRIIKYIAESDRKKAQTRRTWLDEIVSSRRLMMSTYAEFKGVCWCNLLFSIHGSTKEVFYSMFPRSV